LSGVRQNYIRDSVKRFTYFLDNDFKKPDTVHFRALIEELKPKVIILPDIFQPEQTEVAMALYNDFKSGARCVLVPKCKHVIETLPAEATLGYSIPAAFAGTTLPVSDFLDHPVHLLGGTPQEQRNLSGLLNVVSVDCNCFGKQIHMFHKHWDITYPHLKRRSDLDFDGLYEQSFKNIKKYWTAPILEQQTLI
jgi:hypothetical protein